MITLTPELKAYLDEWRAEIHQSLTWLAKPPSPAPATTTPLVVTPAVSIDTSAPVTAPCVTSPVASSDKANIALVSAGLADPAAVVPATGEPRTVAPGAPETTGAMVPATCSTECAAQVVTETTLLPSVSISSSSPTTSATNSMVSTELDSNNDAGENCASFASSSLSSSSTQFTAWDDASPTESENNNIFPTIGVNTMALMLEGISELVHVQEAFSVTATQAKSGKPALKMAPSTSVGFITTVPTTCLTHCSVLQPRAVRWMVASSPPTPTKYSDHELIRLSSSWRITSRVPVHRPTPWPSFSDVHANGDETRPSPWPSFISYCGGGCQKQCYDVQLQTTVQDASSGLKEISVYDVCEEEQQESEQPLKYVGSSPSFSDCERQLVRTQYNYVCWESHIVPHQIQLVPQIRYHACLSLTSCFSLATCVCKKAMEFGIQWWFSFVSDKSRLAFSAFSGGPVSPLAQWLQTLVQVNHHDQDIGLLSVCKLGVTIYKKTCDAVIYLLVGVSASVFQLWGIPWVSSLLLDLTSEGRYSLALFQWEIAWQWRTMHSERECYYQVPMGMQVLDMKQLRWFDISVFGGYNPLISEPVITEFQQLNQLYCYQTAKFCSLPVLELQGSTSNLLPPGTCQAGKVQNYMKFTFSDRYGEGIDFKVGHLFYHVVHHTTQGASGCSGVAFYSHFHMCMSMRNDELLKWLANNLCGSYVSIIQSLQDADQFWVLINLDGEANQHRKSQWDPGGCLFALCSSEKRWTTPLHYHAHLQWSSLRLAGGNQILVEYDFDRVCSNTSSYREDYGWGFSKIKEVHMPCDPGKSSFKHTIPKLRLGDKPSFKEGGMLGPSPSARLVGLVPWACSEGLGPAHNQLQINTYKCPTRGNVEGIRLDQNTATAASSPTLAPIPLPLSCLFICVATEFVYL